MAVRGQNFETNLYLVENFFLLYTRVLILLSVLLIHTSCGQKKFITTGPVNSKFFGTSGEGINDETESLKKAISYCIKHNKKLVIDSGKYFVSSPLLNEKIRKGKLSVYINGEVTIEVIKEKGFTDAPLLSLVFEEFGNVNIEGGELRLKLNNLMPYGLRIEAFGLKKGKMFFGNGGSVNLKNIMIEDIFANQNSNGTACGLVVNGVFDKIFLKDIFVKNVGRHESFPEIPRVGKSVDEAKGIAIINLKGEAVVENVVVENVYTYNDRDADGIAIFGYKPKYNPHDENYKSLGKAIISNAVIIDAQGRGIKIQCSDVKIVNPHFLRKNVKSIIHGNDIDFQWGNGIVENSTHEYISVNGFNPISSKDSYNCIVFQNKLKDARMTSKVTNAKLKSNVPIANFIALITGKDSQSWEVFIKDIHIDEKSAKIINRSVLEFSLNESYGIPSMNFNSKVRMDIKNVDVLSDLVSYTGYNGKKYSQKLRISLDSKDILKSNNKKLFQNLSGLKVEK
jgi:hypothetical protein